MPLAAQPGLTRGKFNMPGDVAHSMLFLGSEDSSMVNGEILVVDGGQSLTTNRHDDYSKQLQYNASK